MTMSESLRKWQRAALEYIDSSAIGSATSEHMVALQMLAEDKLPSVSTGICDTTTAGYGALSEYGYWQYQLPSDLVDKYLDMLRQ